MSSCSHPVDGLETLEFGAFLHDIGKIGVDAGFRVDVAALHAEFATREHRYRRTWITAFEANVIDACNLIPRRLRVADMR